VCAGLVEFAVAAAVEIGATTLANVSHTDRVDADFGAAPMTSATHAAPFPAK